MAFRQYRRSQLCLFDLPIPVDLSYTNATLLTDGENGFPVGNLNWFPTQKVAWLAKRTAEYAAIQKALDNGSDLPAVERTHNVVLSEFSLNQIYTNPFNPTTTISFSLAESSNVSLKVFDILEQEIATLVNGFTAVGSYKVQFDATRLASGVYFYRLTGGDFTQMKKKTLVK